MNSFAIRSSVSLNRSLGCADCGGRCNSLGAVSNYDIITIGGKQYSANQIVDKTITASRDVTLFPSLFKDDGKFVVKSGQQIGKVISYLLPTSASNPTGKVVLQFDRNYNNYFWLKDDNAISTQALKDQGTKTVKDELKEEQEQKEKEESPIEYYLKKYALPGILIIGGIVVVTVIAREFVRGKASANKTESVSKSESRPALTGPVVKKKKKKKSKKVIHL